MELKALMREIPCNRAWVRRRIPRARVDKPKKTISASTYSSDKQEKVGSVVNAKCWSLTTGFAREMKEPGEDAGVYVYHEVRCSQV